MLVLPCVPDGPEVIISAGTVTASTAAFSSMLLTQYFSNYYNHSSDCVTRRGI